MTDMGTLPGDSFSIVGNINDKGQVPIQSCDINFNCRAAIWQDGVMTDLNTLIPSDTGLFLVQASWINSRGQIVGGALDAKGDLVPFLATPVPTHANADAAVQKQNSQSNRRILPESIRTTLSQRAGLGRFRTPLVNP